jgi:hypothetical protein
MIVVFLDELARDWKLAKILPLAASPPEPAVAPTPKEQGRPGAALARFEDRGAIRGEVAAARRESGANPKFENV